MQKESRRDLSAFPQPSLQWIWLVIHTSDQSLTFARDGVVISPFCLAKRPGRMRCIQLRFDLARQQVLDYIEGTVDGTIDLTTSRYRSCCSRHPIVTASFSQHLIPNWTVVRPCRTLLIPVFRVRPASKRQPYTDVCVGYHLVGNAIASPPRASSALSLLHYSLVNGLDEKFAA